MNSFGKLFTSAVVVAMAALGASADASDRYETDPQFVLAPATFGYSYRSYSYPGIYRFPGYGVVRPDGYYGHRYRHKHHHHRRGQERFESGFGPRRHRSHDSYGGWSRNRVPGGYFYRY